MHFSCKMDVLSFHFIQWGHLYSFHNIPSQHTTLKRKLNHHSPQHPCRRHFVGLPDHVLLSTHLRLQYRKTLFWRTVAVNASTHTHTYIYIQYTKKGRYFWLLKRCITLFRFKIPLLMNETLIEWGSGWGGGYLQHSAAGDYNICRGVGMGSWGEAGWKHGWRVTSQRLL